MKQFTKEYTAKIKKCYLEYCQFVSSITLTTFLGEAIHNCLEKLTWSTRNNVKAALNLFLCLSGNDQLFLQTDIVLSRNMFFTWVIGLMIFYMSSYFDIMLL